MGHPQAAALRAATMRHDVATVGSRRPRRVLTVLVASARRSGHARALGAVRTPAALGRETGPRA